MHSNSEIYSKRHTIVMLSLIWHKNLTLNPSPIREGLAPSPIGEGVGNEDKLRQFTINITQFINQ